MTTLLPFFILLFSWAALSCISLAASIEDHQQQEELPPLVGIINGANATVGQAPYQVALMLNGTFQCGGSLVSPRTVVSAAHCVTGLAHRPQDFTVRYGTVDIERGFEEVAVAKVVPHPLFSVKTIDYDVSVLHLAEPFRKSANASVIEMARADPPAGSSATVTGWGMTSNTGGEARYLQLANTMKVVSRAQCNTTWSSTKLKVAITERMICLTSDRQASCVGDSGGPAVVSSSSSSTSASDHILIGVVSFGDTPCNDSLKHPGVFADVANLRGWILANSATL